MIRFDRVNRIRLYTGPTSMRMGIYKIQQLIAFSFSPAEMLNSVFVFCSKSRKCVKVYYEVTNTASGCSRTASRRATSNGRRTRTGG